MAVQQSRYADHLGSRGRGYEEKRRKGNGGENRQKMKSCFLEVYSCLWLGEHNNWMRVRVPLGNIQPFCYKTLILFDTPTAEYTTPSHSQAIHQ